jgi:hypothetical protein
MDWSYAGMVCCTRLSNTLILKFRSLISGKLKPLNRPTPPGLLTGYNAGETQLPDPPVTADLVRDFGARRDGSASASSAFQRAINELPAGSVLRVPAGRYLLTGAVRITKRITIRGDGSDDTTLIMGNGVSSYAFLYWGRQLRNGGTPTRLATVSSTARRGDTSIRVS